MNPFCPELNLLVKEKTVAPSCEQLIQVINIQTEIVKLGLDLGGVMQSIVERILPLIDADGAAIEFAENGEMVYTAASGIAVPQLGLRLSIDKSLSGLCVITGKNLRCDDAESDSRVDRLACRKIGLRSMIVMPLKYEGITVGVLKALSAQPNKFKKQDMTLLEILSDFIGAAMYYSMKYGTDELFIQATHDGMTGLANRSMFMDKLRNVVAIASREDHSSGVLMIDMNGLKQINDTYGHRIGDAVLIEFSNRLKKATRHTDMTARLGGDEFGVILTPLDHLDGIDIAIRRIESETELPFIFESVPYQLSASIGVAITPNDGIDPVKLLEIADGRMYRAKNTLKNNV